jgi:hypothetical protein
LGLRQKLFKSQALLSNRPERSLIKLALGKVIAEDGFSVVKNILDTNNIDLLIQKIALAANSLFAKARHKSIYAIRNALLIPEIRSLAYSQPIASLANTVLNSQALPVKAFLFDKTPQATGKFLGIKMLLLR